MMQQYGNLLFGMHLVPFSQTAVEILRYSFELACCASALENLYLFLGKSLQ